MKIETNLLRNSDRALYSLIIEDKEFYFFLKKFVGSFVFRGNKARAFKMYDEILYILKKTLKKEPLVVLHDVFLKLVPLFSIAYKRVGSRYQPVPRFANKNVRIVLMITWLIRNFKGKSNVRGIRVNDVAKVIIDTYNNKGRALASKKAFYKRALSGRHLLSTYKRKNKRFNFRKKRKQGIEF